MEKISYPVFSEKFVADLEKIFFQRMGYLIRLDDLYVLKKFEHIAEKKTLSNGQTIQCVPVMYKDRKVLFYLPYYYIDLIQKHIMITNSFFETKLLEFFRSLLDQYKPDYQGKTFIDAGTNIGNHTIYFSKYLDAGKVYCFEPQKEVFNILQINLELNNIQAKSYNNILSDCTAYFDFQNFSIANIGGTSFHEVYNQTTQYKSVTLDDICQNEDVYALKIDVEGHEFRVLKGAEKILRQSKPILWIEIWRNRANNQLNEKIQYLDTLGYSLYKQSADDFFFLPITNK